MTLLKWVGQMAKKQAEPMFRKVYKDGETLTLNSVKFIKSEDGKVDAVKLEQAFNPDGTPMLKAANRMARRIMYSSRWAKVRKKWA